MKYFTIKIVHNKTRVLWVHTSFKTGLPSIRSFSFFADITSYGMSWESCHIASKSCKYSSPVEASGRVPWQSLPLQPFEEVGGGESHAAGDGVVISVCKALGDALAQAAHPDHEVRFATHRSHVVGYEAWLASLDKGGVGPGEHNGTFLII